MCAPAVRGAQRQPAGEAAAVLSQLAAAGNALQRRAHSQPARAGARSELPGLQG